MTLCSRLLLALGSAFLCLIPLASTAQTVPAELTGPIELQVNATDTAHKLVQAHEVLQVKGSNLSLDFPEWLPGTHGRTGTIDRLTGLHMRASGREVAWVRDAIDPFRFHVVLPEGSSSLEIELTYLSPSNSASEREMTDSNITEIEWQDVLLYPSGVPADQILVRTHAELPSGYQFATALERNGGREGRIDFKETSLETLIDSPLISGRYFKRVPLNADSAAPVFLDVVAERPDDLEISKEALQAHQALVTQARLLFASVHYQHYDFLLSVSNQIGGIGLEHHQSSEDGVREGYFSDYANSWYARGLLPHEYTHSWNGKYRRPADLATPNYNVPMQGTLLWVYEGQTDYWGNVLAARSGLETSEQAREYFAAVATTVDGRAGRSWRSLEDTTRSPAMGYHQADWLSWQRSAGDYYREMDFVWMQADAIIRRSSGNTRSLDDFARLFFGQEDGQRKVSPYRFEDVVATLHSVADGIDWAAFLNQRLNSTQGSPAASALQEAGWHVEFNDTINAVTEAVNKARESQSFTSSIGLDVGKEDMISDVLWGGPAFKAGAIIGVRLVAVNDEAYTGDVLKRAIKDAQGTREPIRLLIKDGVLYRTIEVDYHQGLRWPHLVRNADGNDLLTPILAPRS